VPRLVAGFRSSHAWRLWTQRIAIAIV